MLLFNFQHQYIKIIYYKKKTKTCALNTVAPNSWNCGLQHSFNPTVPQMFWINGFPTLFDVIMGFVLFHGMLVGCFSWSVGCCVVS